jgi:hypothetical protein
MSVPQVSPQALFNEAAKHKTWEALEACLMNLITTGQVLDYKNEGTFVSVQLDGTNKPIRLPVRFPANPPEAATPTPEPVPAPEVKIAPKTALVTSQAPSGLRKTPVGVVALIGLKSEDYQAHARGLIRFALKPIGMAPEALEAQVESCWKDWSRSLK